MVAENLKNAIIKKIYRDVDKRVPPKDECSPVFRQYLLASNGAFAALSSGMTAGYSAVLLPQLLQDNAEIPITKEEGSWIASMAALPMMLGCLCCGYPMDRFGRKLATIAFAVLFSVGWATLAFADDILELYIGRFLTGFSVGLLSPVCQVYIAETSEPKHRGVLLSASPLSVAIGILTAHVLGTFLHWNITAAICGIPPLITIAILLMCPESPIWLLGQGKFEQAEDSYRWFFGSSEKSKSEWKTILTKGTEAQQQSEAPSKLKLMLRRSFLIPFLVLIAFFFVQQFSGVNAVAFYSVSILKEVMPNLNEYLATIIIDIVRFIISIGGVLLLKRYGRKTLAVTSAIGTGISLFFLSTYLALRPSLEIVDMPQNITNETVLAVMDEVVSEEGFSILHCIPLLCLVSYISFVSIGLVPIPWVLTGELFSKELRGIGSGVTSSFGFIYFFLVVKTSPTMFETMGKAGTFGMFGAISLVGSVMLALFLPETKDKTLLEIEAFYEKRKTVDGETAEARY